MKRSKSTGEIPVKGKSKHLLQGKRHLTVQDVIERYLKTGEPIPENYLKRDPAEIIAMLEKE
jgi:hypothetical protein